MKAKRPVGRCAIRVLRQLASGPKWDGELVSKSGRDELLDQGFAFREDGWHSVTPLGIQALVALGSLRAR